MRSLINFSIKHGKFFHFVSLVIVGFGMFTFYNARKDFIPPVKEAIISVKIIYPGASSEIVRREIVSRVEDEISSIFEIERVSSVSRKNTGIITLFIDRQYYNSVQTVLQKVKDKIDAIELPEISQAPEYTVIDYAADIKVISLHMSGENADDASRELESSLKRLKGINEVEVLGRQDYRYTVNFDPHKLKRMGIPLLEVVQAVKMAIPDIPGGEILQDNVNRNISLTADFDSISAIENIVIRANEDLRSIRIKDLATVEYSLPKPDYIYSYNGIKGIVFKLSKTKNTDIIQFTKSVGRVVEEHQEKNPDISYQIFKDTSIQVTSRLNLLYNNLSIGLILVFIVLLLFFRLSTSLWTVLSIPISFALAAIIAISFFDITINLISMIAFIVALGIVVDDAIVFAENAFRHLEQGESPKEAVIKGMVEVLPSVVFAIMTSVGVILCMLLIGGRVGDFARPLIVVLALCLSVTLFEGILILPSHLLHSFEKYQLSKKTTWRDSFFEPISVAYRKIITFLLAYRKTSFILVAGGFILAAFFLFRSVPFVFFGGPPENIIIHTETEPGTPIEVTFEQVQDIGNILKTYEGLNEVLIEAGYNGSSHRVKIEANIKHGFDPRFNWNILKNQILTMANSNSLLRNTRFYVRREDDTGSSPDLIDISVKGTDYNAVLALANEVKEFAATQPNTENPRLSTSDAGKELRVTVDPEKAYAAGISPRNVALSLSVAFEGTAPRTIIRDGKEIDIYLQYDDKFKTGKDLHNFSVPNKFARFLSLSSFSTIDLEPAQSEIITESGLYSIHVLDTLRNVNVLSNNSFAIQAAVERRFNQKKDSKAAVFFDGIQKDTNQSLNQMLLATILSSVVIFLMLIFMFNSYLHSFLVILMIPFISMGLTFGLKVLNLPMTNMALTGSIALIGMVVNDGIVLMEFLRIYVHGKDDFNKALIDGASLRLRAIFMATSTTVVGIMPLALGFAGSEFFLQPLAAAMMFGILFNSIITLILLPLAVSILENDFKNSFTKSIKLHGAWIALILIPVFPVFSQDKLTNLMTEQDFLTLYLDKAFSPKIYEESLRIAREQKKSAYSSYTGSFFAQTSIAGGYTTNTFPIQNISLQGTPVSDDILANFINGEVAVGVDATVYPTGTYVKIEGGAQFINQSSFRSDLALAPTGQPNINSESIRERYSVPYFEITLAQPFLKNGFAYNMHKKQVNISKNTADATVLQERIRLEETVVDALFKYHSLIFNVQSLIFRRESLDRMNYLLNRQKNLQRLGARAVWDIQQIEANHKKLESAVDIMSISLEKDFIELENRLEITLDRSDIGFLDYSLVADQQYFSDAIYKMALARNTDLAKVRLLVESQQMGADILKNQSLPDLTLSVSYNYSPRISHENTANITTQALYAGLKFSMPLAYHLERAKFLEGKYKAQKAALEQQHYETELLHTSSTYAADWNAIQRDISAKIEVEILLQKVANGAMERWKNSEISLNDLFIHEENLRQAKIDLAESRYRAKKLALMIHLLQGTLLETYQVIENS
ncbi:MAG: efflux RND transporter permease subunit [Brevinema sp.]